MGKTLTKDQKKGNRFLKRNRDRIFKEQGIILTGSKSLKGRRKEEKN